MAVSSRHTGIVIYIEIALGGCKMNVTREEKVEALQTFMKFNPKVIHNIKIIIKELSGARMDDTDVFMRDIVNAINWEIEVLNGTMDLLNEGKKRIDKENVNTCIVNLGKALSEKKDASIAQAFEKLLPELEQVQKAAEEVVIC